MLQRPMDKATADFFSGQKRETKGIGRVDDFTNNNN